MKKVLFALQPRIKSCDCAHPKTLMLHELSKQFFPRKLLVLHSLFVIVILVCYFRRRPNHLEMFGAVRIPLL